MVNPMDQVPECYGQGVLTVRLAGERDSRRYLPARRQGDPFKHPYEWGPWHWACGGVALDPGRVVYWRYDGPAYPRSSELGDSGALCLLRVEGRVSYDSVPHRPVRTSGYERREVGRWWFSDDEDRRRAREAWVERGEVPDT